jgi:hypothetical protein
MLNRQRNGHKQGRLQVVHVAANELLVYVASDRPAQRRTRPSKNRWFPILDDTTASRLVSSPYLLFDQHYVLSV